MNCSDIETLLPLHLAGELEATRMAAFHTHLRQCPLCSLQVEEQTRIDQLTRSAMQAERIDTAALELRVRSRIAADAGVQEMAARHSATQTRNRWITLGAVAAVLLLAIFGGQQYLKWNTLRAYASITHDHFREVTQHQPRDWVSDPQQIAAMISEEGVPSSVLSGLQENGFQIMHARICTLKGQKYLHLVYSNGNHEFSTFFRPQDPLLSLLPMDGSHQGLATADIGAQHLASFHAAHLGVYVVTDESSQAAQKIAGAAASTT